MPGRCRGALLEGWADSVRRRFGGGEAEVLREALGVDALELPDEPGRGAWVRVGVQLALTRLIVERYLDGEMRRLGPLILEDGRRRSAGWLGQLVTRVVPVGHVLRDSGRIHGNLYDIGKVSVMVRRRDALVRWEGAAFMGEPTWRALQCFAVQGLFGAWGGEVELTAARGGEREPSFELGLAW